MIAFFIVLFAMVAFYFIPSFVDSARGHPNRWLILVINLVFGATGLGWFGSLIWARNAVHRSSFGSDGGESGLNLFVNDVHRVAVVNYSELPIEDLGRLKLLLDKGAIDQEEYRLLKGRLLRLGHRP